MKVPTQGQYNEALDKTKALNKSQLGLVVGWVFVAWLEVYWVIREWGGER